MALSHVFLADLLLVRQLFFQPLNFGGLLLEALLQLALLVFKLVEVLLEVCVLLDEALAGEAVIACHLNLAQ